MNFDRSKVIESPTSLPDGKYWCHDTITNLREEVENDESYIIDVDLDDWRYYYPAQLTPLTATKPPRKRPYRVLAPLWERCKR